MTDQEKNVFRELLEAAKEIKKMFQQEGVSLAYQVWTKEIIKFREAISAAEELL